MGDKGEETILRRHCRVYLKTFRAYRDKNLHPFYCHRRAEAAADEAFRLTAEEKRKRDEEWLDKTPELTGRKVEPPEDKGRSLFDDSIMRVE